MNVSREMPKYECHKKVWALKIEAIEFEANSAEDGTAIHKMRGTANSRHVSFNFFGDIIW